MALGVWVVEPLTRILIEKRQLSDKDAAKNIGSYFPDVKDKLLNVLQLTETSAPTDLLQASIAQKAQGLAHYQFAEAVDLSYNRRYLKYLLLPFFIILSIFVVRKEFFTQSTERLVNYNQTYAPEAPFNFKLQNAELVAFKGDDFELRLKTEGSEVPASVTIMTENGRKLKMSSDKVGEFSYTFKQIQNTTDFYFEASGFSSVSHKIDVFARPNLRQFSIFLDYPAYVGKRDERINNTGNLIVPEGTKITWSFKTQATESLALKFSGEEKPLNAASETENTFEFSKKIRNSDNYQVILANEHTQNKDEIEYYLNVLKDQSPTISLRQYEDTVLYNYLILGGNIADDYGITALNLKCQIKQANGKAKGKLQTLKVPFNRDVISQSYFYKLELDSFKLEEGESLEYFVEVWDNDGVNGRKRSATGRFEFKVPTEEEVKEKISTSAKNTEKQMDDVLKESKELSKEMKELQDRLKSKKKLEWQDKKDLKDVVEKQKQLEKDIEKLRKANQLLNEKQKKFNDVDKELAEKAQQLQKLMDELLDEDTKKMYDELNKLLDENGLDKEMMDKLDKMNFNQKNLNNELERSLELFKKLKYDLKAQKLGKDLEKLGKEQEELSEETEKADSKEKMDEVKEKQDEIDKKFEELEKDMKELNEMNDEMKSPNDMGDMNEKQEDIKEQMKETKEQMDSNNKKESSKSQQKAGEKMKQLAKQMEQQMQSSEMEQLNEDYDALRQILENLVKLSFDQERIMDGFRSVRRIDPKFLELSQEQLKLKSDAKVIEDSLVALSKRVFQIESFVTREVTAMNKYMDESIDLIKARPNRVGPRAAGKQQFTMTSINNLALLLNDILRQMQQQMSSSMSGKQMNEQSGSSPSLSEMQKQLNQQIQQLKKSGKSGRALSEELAKMAMMQEKIRESMKRAREGKNGMPGKPGEDGKDGGKPGENGKEEGKGGSGGKTPLEELMEKTEEDLVNKRITEETIKRQREILTRLLESEKALKERELDNKREANEAKNKEKTSPADFSEYLKIKEKQIELLKTIPPSLNPYYKKEVNEYFKKIEK